MLAVSALLVAVLQQAEDPRTAWDAWRNALPEPAALTWEESQVWRIEAAGAHSETSCAVQISEQGRCRIIMRLDESSAPAATEVVELGVLLEDDAGFFWAEMKDSDGTTRKLGMRASRPSLERTYVSLQEEMMRLARSRAEEGDDTWLVHAQRCFPERLAAFLHPARRAHQAAVLTEALAFERRDAEVFVRLKLRLDDGPLAMIAETLDGFGEQEEEVPSLESRGPWWTALASARAELVLDATTGALRSASFQLEAPTGTFGATADGANVVRANLRVERGHATFGEKLDGPPDGLEWQDLEPYLETLRGFLEPAPEVPFITPGLPPPPY